MSHLVCPLDILFSLPSDVDKCGHDGSDCAQLMPRLRTIGIGDGGNEVDSFAAAATYILSCNLFRVSIPVTDILFLLLCVCFFVSYISHD